MSSRRKLVDRDGTLRMTLDRGKFGMGRVSKTARSRPSNACTSNDSAATSTSVGRSRTERSRIFRRGFGDAQLKGVPDVTPWVSM